MTALSELLQGANVAPARAIDRIEKSDEHKMNRATIYRYVEGDHPERPKEKYLQALAYGFELPVTQVREAAAAAPGELDLWTPPLESGQLSKPVREALDALIKTLAKEGTQRAADAAQKTDEVSRRRSTPRPQDVPEIPEGLAADDPGEPTQYVLQEDEQDAAYDIDQDQNR